MPFLSIILHEQGLSDAQTNVALTANGLAALFSPLIISHFADRLFAMRHLLSVLIGATTLLCPLWLFVNTLGLALFTTFVFFSLLMPAISMLDAYTIGAVAFLTLLFSASSAKKSVVAAHDN